MNKRGAVTVFIILGIVIVAIVGLLFFALSGNIDFKRFTGLQTEPVRDYVETCVEESLALNVYNFEQYAGYDGVALAHPHQGYYVNYLVYNDGSFILNRINPKPYLESRISEDVANHLEYNCLNGVDFGGDTLVDFGSMDVKTEIMPDKVFVTVDLPINVKKGSVEVNVNNFLVVYDTNFGTIYDAVRDIIEDEINLGDFDPTNYMVENRNIEIIKEVKQDDDRSFIIVYAVKSNDNDEMIVFAVKR